MNAALVAFLSGLLIGGATTSLVYKKHQADASALAAPEPCVHDPADQRHRTWADLFAACRLVDSWLGSDFDGNPGCYDACLCEVRQ